MSNSNDDLRSERERLQAEIARLQVSRDSGVPVILLGDAATVTIVPADTPRDSARPMIGEIALVEQ